MSLAHLTGRVVCGPRFTKWPTARLAITTINQMRKACARLGGFPRAPGAFLQVAEQRDSGRPTSLDGSFNNT
jgi:hypothetical protein